MRNVNRGIMPGLQFRPGIWVCFNSLRGGDVLVPPADVLKGTRRFHTVAFGGELWILEHGGFIGLFAFFFASMPGFEARFAKAAMTVYSCRGGKNNFAHLERMPSSK